MRYILILGLHFPNNGCATILRMERSIIARQKVRAARRPVDGRLKTFWPVATVWPQSTTAILIPILTTDSKTAFTPCSTKKVKQNLLRTNGDPLAPGHGD